ncbi:MAG: hypothetical protein RL708_1974 [Bacteroidota bacterium]|jgi:hypothetical protein
MIKIVRCIVAVSLLSFVLVACKKGAGEGGKATITGKIFATNYNALLKSDSGFIGDYKVYINYGNETGVSNDVATDYSGVFKFNYLRKGNYTVWVYSKKNSLYVLDSTIIKSVEISDKTETIDLGTIRINTRKN